MRSCRLFHAASVPRVGVLGTTALTGDADVVYDPECGTNETVPSYSSCFDYYCRASPRSATLYFINSVQEVFAPPLSLLCACV